MKRETLEDMLDCCIDQLGIRYTLHNLQGRSIDRADYMRLERERDLYMGLTDKIDDAILYIINNEIGD